MQTLNLGILAHVDAGKTSLTERLLHAAGVIDEIGRVDDGNTQTDSLALERQRGITIKSAVASFAIGDVSVNLIDTPGHPDFIAEVERVLSVLDGAVLVVSGVEGVQAQTRVLMRVLQRLRIPTLLFVNKLDRAAADGARALRGIAEKLTPAIVAMGEASDSALVELLALHDDALLEAYVEDDAVSIARLRAGLAAQTRQALVHPVFLGSARTGAGIDELMAGIATLLPPADGDADGPLAGTVFKIERGPSGERIAYARLFSGTLRTRERLGEEKVTALEVLGPGEARGEARAGDIAKVWGLRDVQIGDAIGEPRGPERHHFAPPTLETVVVPHRRADRRALRVALGQLAEQDPLIGLRQDEELALSLYGEVQKEVIEATLADEFGLEVSFRETTTICIERPVGPGTAVELIGSDPNPFLATVGLRIEPGAPGSGITFELEVELGSMPYSFFKAVEETVHETLRQGLHGWQVVDCAVTMTHSGYWAKQSHSHATFDKSMSSTARDFRQVTPLVAIDALRQAGTEVQEPMHRFRLEAPADALGPLLPALAQLGAIPEPPTTTGVIVGEIPAAQVHALRQQLPALTRGEGLLESEFERYQPARGATPQRTRRGHDPRDREAYVLRVLRPSAGMSA